ncbi:replication-relaxation family protein [Bacillus sp. BRMEA1]|uniref:replication-relaxation family protein n=1 Tax=Neobacillus endophyticus TaxID=2738405 RepID=UPI00156396B4|nr:replication-relaxation family protein [Neobacillus endophyticus]NRD80820.1 replication-relaxation family protein [Neobacillus endophyticus]
MNDVYIGENSRRISLKDYELELLYRVYKNRLLTTNQLYRWIGAENVIRYDSFSRRLNKFTQNSLLVRHEYSLGQKGFRYHYFSIGTKGIEVLLSSGYLSSDTKLYNHFKVAGAKRLDHYLSTQEVVISTMLRIRNEGIEGIEDFSPYDYLYMDETAASQDKKFVVPDWIIKSDDKFINIELDTGTESLEMIRDKLKGYIRLAQSRKTETHIVLMAVIDDFFPTRFAYPERQRRIGNMKQALVCTPDIQCPNLQVFIVSLSNATELAYRIIRNQIPFDLESKSMDVQVAVTLLGEYNEVFEYKFSELKPDIFYNPSIPKHYYADGIYKLSNHAGTFSETVMFLVMDEGYVQALDRLDFLYKSAFQFNSFNEQIDRMIVLYDSLTSLQSDIFGAEYPKVLFIDGQTLTSTVRQEPNFFKQISPYRMEITTYDKSR